MRRQTMWATLGAAITLGAVAVAPTSALAASTLSQTSTATYQANGRVASVVTIGNTTYLGGSFTAVRPAGAAPGSSGVARQHLAAVNATTGALRPWNPGADKEVYALTASPDGSTVYAGGLFGVVGGQARKRAAAISASTGAVTAFRADTDLKVLRIVASASRVYLGGTFTAVNGISRSRLAAVSLTGAVDPAFATGADDRVRGLALSADGASLWVGGDFTALGGQPGTAHLGKLSLSGASVQPFATPPPWPVHIILPSGSVIFVGGDGDGGHAASYDVNGNVRWIKQTDGGVQALALSNNVLYLGGHFDNICVGDNLKPAGNTGPFICPVRDANRHKLVALDPTTAVTDPWNPGADSPLGVFSMDLVNGWLHVGGDFSILGGRNQQGYGAFR